MFVGFRGENSLSAHRLASSPVPHLPLFYILHSPVPLSHSYSTHFSHNPLPCDSFSLSLPLSPHQPLPYPLSPSFPYLSLSLLFPFPIPLPPPSAPPPPPRSLPHLSLSLSLFFPIPAPFPTSPSPSSSIPTIPSPSPSPASFFLRDQDHYTFPVGVSVSCHLTPRHNPVKKTKGFCVVSTVHFFISSFANLFRDRYLCQSFMTVLFCTSAYMVL